MRKETEERLTLNTQMPGTDTGMSRFILARYIPLYSILDLQWPRSTIQMIGHSLLIF
jgi:hypothetical protein